jgi:hypothetical protein
LPIGFSALLRSKRSAPVNTRFALGRRCDAAVGLCLAIGARFWFTLPKAGIALAIVAFAAPRCWVEPISKGAKCPLRAPLESFQRMLKTLNVLRSALSMDRRLLTGWAA